MTSRVVIACGVAFVAAASGCSPPPEDGSADRRPSATSADSGSEASTPLIRQDLSSDLSNAERDLSGFEDSINVFMGSAYAANLRNVRAKWVEYRQLQCDALRLAFSPGTLAPAAQLDCLVSLTDERRKFLGEQYNFVRPARLGTQPGQP